LNVLVDTSVWSVALRRARHVDNAITVELTELVQEGRVAMIGPVRQELLSGVKVKAQFEMLRERLRAWTDLELDQSDYEDAASCFNRCRERGIQGSNTDFLICAVAAKRELSISTTDGDFKHFARVLKLELHQIRA
jgi:predicted nucleic acid-binding protein